MPTLEQQQPLWMFAAVQSSSVRVYQQRLCAMLPLRLALTPFYAVDCFVARQAGRRNRGSAVSWGAAAMGWGWSSASQGIRCSTDDAVVTAC